jgi:hypothetical protein
MKCKMSKKCEWYDLISYRCNYIQPDVLTCYGRKVIGRR